MIVYDIPGRGKVEIENIILDYNGTIAVEGQLIEGVQEKLLDIKDKLKIHIVTADTYGTVEKQCEDIGINVITFPKENAGESKKLILENLGKEKTICVGNGFNDIEMFKNCKISIAIIEKEGCSGKLLLHADIVTKSIIDALNIILNENMMKATLRN